MNGISAESLVRRLVDEYVCCEKRDRVVIGDSLREHVFRRGGATKEVEILFLPRHSNQPQSLYSKGSTLNNQKNILNSQSRGERDTGHWAQHTSRVSICSYVLRKPLSNGCGLCSVHVQPSDSRTRSFQKAYPKSQTGDDTATSESMPAANSSPHRTSSTLPRGPSSSYAWSSGSQFIDKGQMKQVLSYLRQEWRSQRPVNSNRPQGRSSTPGVPRSLAYTSGSHTNSMSSLPKLALSRQHHSNFSRGEVSKMSNRSLQAKAAASAVQKRFARSQSLSGFHQGYSSRDGASSNRGLSSRKNLRPPFKLHGNF